MPIEDPSLVVSTSEFCKNVFVKGETNVPVDRTLQVISNFEISSLSNRKRLLGEDLNDVTGS